MKADRYETMSVITSLCRSFADQVLLSMKNKGLLDDGYRLYIEIGNEFMKNDGLKAIIKLEQPNVPDEEFFKNRMSQVNILGMEWKVIDDPKTEAGTLPPEVFYKNGERHIRKGHGENADKPYPVDGLWVGLDYNDPYVDGGQ